LGIAFANGLPPTTAGYLRADFGLAIPAGTPDDALLRVHPTQLYETAIALGIFAVGYRLLRRHPAPGTTALVMFALLALERFGIEFLRAKDDRFFGPLTLAQVISLAIFVAVALLAWRRRSNLAGAIGEVAAR
jgi:prolipoprotein diacylglyceryltransferase